MKEVGLEYLVVVECESEVEQREVWAYWKGCGYDCALTQI